MIVTPSFNGGGAERIAVNLANFYASEGIRVVLVAFKAKGPNRAQVSNMVEIVDLDSRARASLFKLVRVIKDKKPDVLLSAMRDSNILAGLASYFVAINAVYREASTMDAISLMPGLKSSIYKILMRVSYARAKYIIANSEDTSNDLVRFRVAQRRKCLVIGNPVLPNDIDFLASSSICDEWLLNSRFKVVLNVGRFHELKNQSLLLRAFAIVNTNFPDSRLILLGEGSEKDTLVHLCDHLGLSGVVKFVPFQQNPFPFFKRASVFVLTSKWEGFGNVIVEAMACETPVISTNCPGGPKSILNHGEFGVLVGLDNVSELASKIISELRVPSSPEFLANSKQRAMRYTVESVACEYKKILNSAWTE